MDESSKVVQDKACLVSQGYLQQKRVDYDKTFALFAKLESIQILEAYASLKVFKLFQMDVKRVFLNGFIDEQVFVKQPTGFKNHKFPYHVFNLSKTLWFKTSS